MNLPKLLPCPFCGSHAEVHTPKSGDYQDDPDVQPTYSCSARGCMASHYCMDLVDWNTRAPAPQPGKAGRVEALEEVARCAFDLGPHCYGVHQCAETNKNPRVQEMIREGSTCRYCDMTRALALLQKDGG